MKDYRYYTPELNEFYIGFEYEWKRDGEGATPWTKSTFDIKANPFDVDSQRMNDYRVKYLDKKDIESLGFKEIYEDVFSSNYNDPRKINSKVHIIVNDLNHHVLISIGDDDVSHYDWITKFSGNIKNKFELEQVLKQTINYERENN